MKKVIVTGGAGFIGSHTVVALHQAGYLPIVVDDFSNSQPVVLERLRQLTGAEIPAHELDCCQEADFREVFEAAGEVLGVIHFAARKSVSESVREPLRYYRNNLGSLEVLLGLMAAFSVPHLVFSSSCTVYGQAAVLPVTEETPRLPAESPYGRSKQICEDMIQDVLASGAALRAVMLRYFNPVGAHESGLIGELPLGTPENLVPYITQTGAGLREQLTVFGDDYDTPDGSCIRDYIHVVDLAGAHVKALDWMAQQDRPAFAEVFNVGTGRGVSVLEAIRAFEEASGKPLNYRVGARRPGDIEKIWADTTRCRQVLGFEATRTIEQAMRDAWNWQQRLAAPEA